MRVNKRDLRHQLYGIKKTYGLICLLTNQVIAINDDLMPIQGLNCSFNNSQISQLRINLEDLPKSNSYMYFENNIDIGENHINYKKESSLSDGILDLANSKNEVFTQGYQIYKTLISQDLQLDNITVYAIKHALDSPDLHSAINLYAQHCNLDFERACDELKMLLEGNVHSQITALGFWQNLVKKLTEADFINDVKTVQSDLSKFVFSSDVQ